MSEKINILGIQIDRVNMKEALNKVQGFIEKKEKHKLVVTPNSEIIVMALEETELAEVINSADLSVPDGAGVVLASRLLKKNLPERVAGFDLMNEIIKLSAEKEYNLYLLGGEPGTVEIVEDNLKRKYPTLKISGSHHGYLNRESLQKIIKEVNYLKPDILLIGMGVPLQEKFLGKNLLNLEVRVAMTIGGSFDVIAGKTRRAPSWMQKLNLEWLFRLLQEPRRIGRMMALPRFALLVFREYLRNLVILKD